ncbi:hypothetical protein [Staphylococcus phage vB_StaM_SA1]|nr:hypothetical protein [Staphylococcus phage vB_StaM_SA1]
MPSRVEINSSGMIISTVGVKMDDQNKKMREFILDIKRTGNYNQKDLDELVKEIVKDNFK